MVHVSKLQNLKASLHMAKALFSEFFSVRDRPIERSGGGRKKLEIRRAMKEVNASLVIAAWVQWFYNSSSKDTPGNTGTHNSSGTLAADLMFPLSIIIQKVIGFW